jgi:glycosyltransferase involved in cell wall biosynthesis
MPCFAKVLVVAAMDVTSAGAAAKRSQQFASLFAGAGCEVQLLGFGPPKSGAIAGLDMRVAVTTISDSASSVVARLRSLLGQNGSLKARRALIQRIGEILIESHGPRAVLLYNQDPWIAIQVTKLCRRHGADFIQQFAEMHLPEDYPIGRMHGHYIRERLHLRLVPRRANANIVISSTLRELVRQRGGQNLLELPSFVDAEYWDKSLAACQQKTIPRQVLYVGAGARRDDLKSALLAVVRCRANNQLINLHLVGLHPSVQRSCAKWAKRDGIRDQVEILGRIDQDALEREYVAASAMLLLRTDDLSSRACFPTRLGEMLLASKPVIMSSIPDYNLHFRDRENAYLVESGDVESISQALSAASEPSAGNDRIGSNGRAVALTKLNVMTYVPAIRKLLGELPSAK